MPMTDPLLIELQTRLAYQDETLRVLSDEVARQQRQIERLERRCLELAERLSSANDGPAPNPPADEIPPHY